MAATGSGLWLLARLGLRLPRQIQHIICACGLGLGIVGYVMFVLGVTGALRTEIIGFSYGTVVTLGLVNCISYWRSGASVSQGPPRRLDIVSWILMSVLIGLAGINLVGALSPVVGVDELIYRLAAPKVYLRHGSFMYIPSIWLHQQPQLIMTVQMWGMALGSHSTAQLLQWALGLVLLLGVVDLGMKEMPIRWALCGGVIFYCCSDVSFLSGRATPDLANALFLFVALVVWLQWTETDQVRWLMLCGVFAGLFASGARLPGAYAAIGLAAVSFGYSLYRRSNSPIAALRNAALVGLLSLVTVLPWYIKSWLQTGNPFWPFMHRVFGARDWTVDALNYVASIQERHIGDWVSWGRILYSPWELTMEPGGFASGVIGPILLASVPLVFAVAISENMRRAVAVCAVLYVVWYLSYPRVRAGLAPIAMLCAVAAFLGWQMCSTKGFPRWAVSAYYLSIAAWIALGVAAALRFHGPALPVVLGLEDESEYLVERFRKPDLRFTWYVDLMALNVRLPQGSRVLLHDQRGYHLDHDYERLALISAREKLPHRLKDPDYVAHAVHQLGCTHVAVFPTTQHKTGYEPTNWLEDTVHELCRERWPITYRSARMIVCDTGRQR